MKRDIDPEQIYAITRPEPVLLTYYLLGSLLTLILFPFVFLPGLIRYLTLRYRFDSEGIHKAYGLIFRKEDVVQYARIQDLHVTRNVLQRWLGLGTVEVQTAAGSAGANMKIIGLTNVAELRDFLYTRMRGARFGDESARDAGAPSAHADEVVELLTAIRDELRLLRGQRS
jgi:putative membrane protein